MEETQLLRTLTLTTALAALACFAVLPAFSQETPPDVQFAPGSLGDLGVDVDDLMLQARKSGEEMRDTLQTQDPAYIGDMSPALEALQERAMNDPRVRELLGVGADNAAAGEERIKYDEAKVLVFASFAMPAPSLQKVMAHAEKYNAQVVFRGFVDNSVFKTEAALTEVFGDLNLASGFAIDPTLFTRFKVQAVPVYIVLNGPLDVCENPGCAGDALPPHDRISGNIELEAALNIAARARGDATTVALAVLASQAASQKAAGTAP
jgi:conjugal transfer pilus assembly protein TrbC